MELTLSLKLTRKKILEEKEMENLIGKEVCLLSSSEHGHFYGTVTEVYKHMIRVVGEHDNHRERKDDIWFNTMSSNFESIEILQENQIKPA